MAHTLVIHWRRLAGVCHRFCSEGGGGGSCLKSQTVEMAKMQGSYPTQKEFRNLQFLPNENKQSSMEKSFKVG